MNATTTVVTIRTSNLDGDLCFLVPPVNQGQIVEVSYAGLYDGRVLCRTVDRSDRSVSYAVARLADDEVEDDSPCGLNHEPRIDGDWTPAALIDDGPTDDE